MNPTQLVTSFQETVTKPQNSTAKNSVARVSFMGFVVGSAAGMGVNLLRNASLFAKCAYSHVSLNILSRGQCDNPLTPFDFDVLGQPLLATINAYKQSEIESFAFAVPFLPLITDIAVTTLSKTYEEGFLGGLQELKSRFTALPVLEFLKPIAACALGVFARSYMTQILSNDDPTTVLYRFKPSGHVIAKLAAATLLFDAMKTTVTSAQGSKKRLALAQVQVAAIVLTDLVMMVKTGAIHHSVAEMAAGVALFALAYKIADQVIPPCFQKIKAYFS